MEVKAKSSKINIFITAALIFFVSLLCFSIGVITGKGWSDRERYVEFIESDSHLHAAQKDSRPIGEGVSKKEVELLTQKALQLAKAQIPRIKKLAQATTGLFSKNRKLASSQGEEGKAKREMSSVMPMAPKPASVEFTVQVASYKTIKEAEEHSQRLIDKGFPAFPVRATINGELWHRVSIGTFKTRKQAILYERRLKKQAVVRNTFVQKIKRPGR